ncbi:MAG: tetratricopeptide repeat protein [Microcoleaceae cyanobacterium]
MALTNLGTAYNSLSQSQKAIEFFQQSVQVTETIRAQISAASQKAYMATAITNRRSSIKVQQVATRLSVEEGSRLDSASEIACFG